MSNSLDTIRNKITAEQKEKERRRTLFLNRNSLPRWIRRLTAPKTHTHEQENARRKCQMACGVLRPVSRGWVVIAAERVDEEAA